MYIVNSHGGIDRKMEERLLYIIEDDDYGNFGPLTVNRAVYQLRLGIDLLHEKWTSFIPASETRLTIRNELAGIASEKIGMRCNDFRGVASSGAVFVNGRYIADSSLAETIRSLDKAQILLCEGNLVAAFVPAGSAEASDLERLKFWGYGHFKEIIKKIPKKDVIATEVKHIWDFIRLNPEQISADFERITQDAGGASIAESSLVDAGCTIHNRCAVRIAEGAMVDSQVVIDARGGPVYIGFGARIEPHTRIEGPCYVGENTMLVGGKIREGCSIGPVCKVGGELEESIILGHSNKFHDGFLGHAYLGEWVNLGAMTTNSDLKNNYGTIRVDLGEGQQDTGMTKVGSFIGDHVKTGIGTMLNTGISLGFATNVFGAGLVADKFVPPFCWGSSGNYAEYDIERAIATARVVVERRNVAFTAEDERVFRAVFEESLEKRAHFIDSSKSDRG